MTSGHLGVEKTSAKVRQRFYWFNQRDNIELYIKRCRTCQECKNEPYRPRAPLQSIRTGFPLERLGIDIVGPLPTSEKGNKYITVVVDYFTKYPLAFATDNIRTETVAEELMDRVLCTLVCQ